MEEINAAEVTGMIGNTNPDITHTDLLMVVIRYITKEKVPSERPIKNVPVDGDEKAGIGLAHLLIKTIKKCKCLHNIGQIQRCAEKCSHHSGKTHHIYCVSST